MHPLYKILKNTQAKRSGNGTVWQAHDEVLDREVALKELRNWASRPARARACFQFGHIRRLTLSHAGLAPVHGTDCDRGWLVLDYYPQGSLAEQTDSMPADAVRRVLVDVLQTLTYLHSKGFVHGAIKPANLFVPAQGPVVLGDGLGIRLNEKGRTLGMRGLFQAFDSIEGKYLAPECLDGKEDRVGPATDLYALGWTALELLLGEQWFASLFPLVRVAAQRWDEWQSSEEVLPPLRQLAADTPADLAEVIEGFIHKNPAQRLTIARALALLCPPAPEDIGGQAKPKRTPIPEKKPVASEPISPARPIVSPPPSPAAFGVRPQRTRLRLPALLGTGLAGIALGVSLSLAMPTRRATEEGPAQVATSAPEPVPAVSPVEKPTLTPLVVKPSAHLARELKAAQAETTQAHAEVAQHKASIERLKGEVNRLASDLQSIQTESLRHQAKSRELQDRADRLAGELKSAETESLHQRTEGTALRDRADRLAGELKSAQAKLGLAKTATEKQRAAASKLAKDLKEAQTSLSRARAEIEEQRVRLENRTRVKAPGEPALLAPGAEKQAIPLVLAALKDLGARVEVDKERPDQPVVKVDLTGTKVTNNQLLLLEGLPGLRVLSVSSTAIGDIGLRHLKKLTGLETLSLYDTKVTDAGLVHLADMTHLKTLYLSSANSDVGLMHLKKLAGLETLSLYDTKVTDTGLVHLEGMTRLKMLYLSSTRVGNAGLIHLKGFPRLQTLFLSHTQVTDTGLSHLRGLKNLQRLNLATTQVTDAGLAHLRDLSNLQELYLTYTQISDIGLTHLKGLAKLREVDVGFTRVTEKAVTELRLALPGCEVRHESLQTGATIPR